MINIRGKEQVYEIIMPDGKKIRLWFIGKQLEELLKVYNIPFKIKKKIG